MSTALFPTKTDAAAELERCRRMYRRMVMIRLFEEQVNDLYTRALMPGLAHLYIGEEAVAVGVCEALRADECQGWKVADRPQPARRGSADR